MSRPTLYRFAELEVDGDPQVIRHGSKADQDLIVRRVRLALAGWRFRAARRLSQRRAREIREQQFEIRRPTPARVEIRRVA